ncbi:MAG: 3-deoxy-D-manno-octulosonic acid kinase [Woeseiaceae bacterium]|nr:3-deoxy-D-manno-octulosonic acid kinase [Woeseiaceae bacterium]
MTAGYVGDLPVIHETVEKTASGAMIYDASVVPDASEKAFSAAGWKTVRRVENVLRSGGRGNTLILGDGEREFVLRHFRRGGLLGKVNRDRYLWTGEDNTRPFTEWRILQKLANRGMPVPRPAIARYCRYGPTYTADIITLRVPGIRSLSARLADERPDASLWQRIGAGLWSFHEAGVNHADLNAHNVQIDDSGRMWLLDFDKARIMAPGPWKQRNLARLHRSLKKIRSQDSRVAYREADWQSLLDGYFQASRSA